MFKFFALILLPLVLVACTASKTPETTSVSSEIPADAKSMSGYDYPAVPLDQYKTQTQSGANPV